jgi:hypothetical protein
MAKKKIGYISLLITDARKNGSGVERFEGI